MLFRSSKAKMLRVHGQNTLSKAKMLRVHGQNTLSKAKTLRVHGQNTLSKAKMLNITIYYHQHETCRLEHWCLFIYVFMCQQLFKIYLKLPSLVHVLMN